MTFNLSYWVGLTLNFKFILALCIVVFSIVIISYRYKILLKYYGEKISFIDSFYITNVSNFLSYFSPATIGTLIAKPLVTKFFSKILIRKSTFVTIFEQIFEIGWQVILLVILLLFIGEKFLFNNAFLKLIIFFLVIFIFTITFINYKKIVAFLVQRKNLLPKKIKQICKRMHLSEQYINEIMDNMGQFILNPKIFLVSILITASFVLIFPIIMIELANIFSTPFSYVSAFIIFWTAVIVGRFSSIPGGFGSREITLAGLLIAYGIPTAIAVKITILARVVVLIPAILLGGSLFLYISTKVSFKKMRSKFRASN